MRNWSNQEARITMRSARVLTIAEAHKQFLTAKRAIGVSDKTIQTYQNHLRSIGHDLDLKMPIEDLRKRDLDEMIDSMRRRGLAPQSIQSYTRSFKAFLSWCNMEEYTEVNLPVYKAPEAVKEPYTDAELRKLLKKPNMRKCGFNEYRTWVIINLLINNGPRAATIRNILICDLDLEKASITTRHNKNGRIQIIPLCSEMVAILKEYLRYRRGNFNDYLFPNECGQQMSESVLRDAIKTYNHHRGVAKTSIHLFRHTFAKKYLLDCGGNAFTLQKLLGHSTLDMTRHYCAIYDADLAKDFDSFSPLMQLKRG